MAQACCRRDAAFGLPHRACNLVGSAVPVPVAVDVCFALVPSCVGFPVAGPVC